MALRGNRVALLLALGAGLAITAVAPYFASSDSQPRAVAVPVGATKAGGGRTKVIVPASALAVASAPSHPELAAVSKQFNDIHALIDDNCIGCHDEATHSGDFVIEKYSDAYSIRKDRRQWARVLAMVGGGAMPPEGAPQLPKKDREQFVAEAKTILEYTDPNRPDPGHITMRRLNRTEYDNTVYDLFKINFYPSAEFPPDDVGGGYDNNGDTLTISPLLMERYIAASESIIKDGLDGNWPNHAKMEQFTPPAGGAFFRQTSFGRTGIRHIPYGMKITGQLTNQTTIRQEGDYIFQAFAYYHPGNDADGKPVDVPTMNIEVDDKFVKSFEVTVIGYEGSIFYKVPVHLTTGIHRFGISCVLKEGQTAPKFNFDPLGKTEPPGLHVRWAEVEGPHQKAAIEDTFLAHKEGLSPRDAAKEVVERFASKAFRRPASNEEVEGLLAFYDDSAKEGLTWYESLRPAIQATICSPQFLFRPEIDDHPEATGPHPINDYQLATRLSYFIWSSMPDDELLALAAKNELHNNVEAQIRRMLKDQDRIVQLRDNFGSQWLHLRMLFKVMPDKEKFPEYTPELREAMAGETLQLFGAVINEDRSILDLIDSDFTYLNGPLAGLYGIVDTKGNLKDQANPVAGGTPIVTNPRSADYNKFVRVQLQNKDRAGILTQASILTVTSNPGRTSPVKRGKFIMEQILGDSPPPPPPNVPSLDTPAHPQTGNLRQRMEQHRADPRCAACHMEMDQLGFALENFNPIGRFRDKDEDSTIDASGVLPDGTKFTGAAELKAMLKAKGDVFTGTLATQLLTYALGRQMEYYDKPAIDKIVKAVAADNYKFSRLVIEIANSEPFRFRRGKDQTDE